MRLSSSSDVFPFPNDFGLDLLLKVRSGNVPSESDTGVPAKLFTEINKYLLMCTLKLTQTHNTVKIVHTFDASSNVDQNT